MGLVSLEPFDLRIKERSGSQEERRLAKRLLPLVTNTPHHQMLVTLLLCNSIANEALPLFLDELVPTWCAVIISVVFVLVFGEILPSAIFTGPAKLAVASFFVDMVWGLMLVLSPIAWPIARVLDYFIPEETEFMTRAEVRAMIEIQREVAVDEGHREPFNKDEESMIKGTLSLSVTKVDAPDILKPTSKLFSLPYDGLMDRPTMRAITSHGYSRVPVYVDDDYSNIIGYLLIKDLIELDPDDGIPIADLDLYEPVSLPQPSTDRPAKRLSTDHPSSTPPVHPPQPTLATAATAMLQVIVGPNTTLRDCLNKFQTGASHLAFVSKNPSVTQAAITEFHEQRFNARAKGTQVPMSPKQTKGKVGMSNILRRRSTKPLGSSHVPIGVITLEDIIEEVLTEVSSSFCSCSCCFGKLVYYLLEISSW